MTEGTWKMSSTLTFNSLAESHDANVTCAVRYSNNITTLETVTLNVTYVKEIKVSGALIIREGETLNLTCSLDSFPPSVLTWTKSPETTETFLQINSNDFCGSNNNSRSFQLEQRDGMASFSLSNVKTKDSGQYICTAKHLNTTLMEKVDIKVICAVQCSDSGSVLPWSVTAVALIIGVVSVICVLRLWKAGQKTRAKNENSTYMSLQKTHPTSEYDVIHQL
ncbi:sialic acid-binding Ig-like lectin 5 [Takifugu flavidus]|uniref:sialic acid-binding Ig-like lectin 5 n=1 Tax=Takifugu flavidus TaxID=433684 RepID=UPI002544CA9A|nr:sialic acid-binding Ig-like lectin 5 [Takifugu flavidus]